MSHRQKEALTDLMRSMTVSLKLALSISLPYPTSPGVSEGTISSLLVLFKSTTFLDDDLLLISLRKKKH